MTVSSPPAESPPSGKTQSSEESRVNSIMIFIVLIFYAGLLLAVSSLLFVKSQSEPKAIVCETPSCYELTNTLNKIMSKEIKPCVDFYKYACGEWTLLDRLFWKLKGNGFEDPAKILRQYLDGEKETEGNDMDNLRKLYQSCNEQPDRVKENFGELNQFIEDLGGWGFSNTALNLTNWSPQKAVEKVFDVAHVNVFFRLDIDRDIADEGKHAITLAMPDFKYVDSDIERLSLSEKPQGKFPSRKKQASDYSELFQIYKKSILGTSRFDLKMDIMSIEGMNSIAPYFDWLGILQNIFTKVNINIDGTTLIQVRHKNYFVQMNEFFKNLTSERNLTIANFITLQALLAHDRVMWPGVTNLLEGGPRPIDMEKRYDTCAMLVEKKLSSLASLLVYRRMSNLKSIKLVRDIVDRTRTAIVQRIGNRTWISQRMREVLIDKVTRVRVHMSIPEFADNPQRLSEYLATFPQFDASSLLKNVLAINKRNVLRKYRTLASSREKFYFEESYFKWPASYIDYVNTIYMKADRLREPWFHPEYPSAVNIGYLSRLIAREFYIALDTKSKQYNDDGDYENLWDPNDAFNAGFQTPCFIHQYSYYHENNIEVDGEKTLASNLADNGGLQVAYDVYRQLKAENPNAPSVLPDSEFTSDQLFFIASAQSFCSFGLRVYWFNYTHPVPPDSARVKGAVDNSKEFAEAFYCPVANYRTQCLYW